MESQKQFVCDSIRKCLLENQERVYKEPIIDNLIEKFKLYYDKPVSSFSELKKRDNKKIKGDVFEVLAKLYFETKKNKKSFVYQNCWLLKEIPKEIKQDLGLRGRDMGIDLILQDQNDEFHAVQVKYRFPNRYKSKNILGWKQLSTFYSWVNRTGPYKKHIIFTNADYVRHVGNRDPKDKSICIGTLRNISRNHWYRMIEDENSGRTIGDSSNCLTISELEKMTKEELRELRLKCFS